MCSDLEFVEQPGWMCRTTSSTNFIQFNSIPQCGQRNNRSRFHKGVAGDSDSDTGVKGVVHSARSRRTKSHIVRSFPEYRLSNIRKEGRAAGKELSRIVSDYLERRPGLMESMGSVRRKCLMEA